MGASHAKIVTRATELIDLLMKSNQEYEDEVQKHIFEHVAAIPGVSSSPESRLRAKLLADFLTPSGLFSDRLRSSLRQYSVSLQIELDAAHMDSAIRKALDTIVERYQARVSGEEAKLKKQGGVDGTHAQKELAVQQELAKTWGELEF